MQETDVDRNGVRWHWKLQISKNKKIELASCGWGDRERHLGPIVGETLSCRNEEGFEVEKNKRRDGDWSKWVKKITFDFEEECRGAEGKAECNIKIADTVGLKNSCVNL